MNYASGLLLTDRYRLEELIAEGGMGQVWRAIDETLQRPVAVKVMHAGLGDDLANGDSGGDEVFGSAASGHGSFGEQVLLDAASTTPVPDGLDVVDAACIPVAYATAHDVLDHLAVFLVGEGRAFAGGADGDKPVAALFQVPFDQPLERGQVELSLRGERGDERGQRAFEHGVS